MVDEYQIHCVTQVNNVITHVGIGTEKYTVSQIVSWIRNGQFAFYTMKNGYKAKVYAKQSVYGNWFLTTEPDSTRENNLDFLPSCIF